MKPAVRAVARPACGAVLLSVLAGPLPASPPEYLAAEKPAAASLEDEQPPMVEAYAEVELPSVETERRALTMAEKVLARKVVGAKG